MRLTRLAVPALAVAILATAGGAAAHAATTPDPTPATVVTYPGDVVDQTLPQYAPGERRQDMTREEFGKVWGMRVAEEKRQRDAGLVVSPYALDSAGSDYDAQLADTTSTTTRYSYSQTQPCPEPSAWGGTSSIAIAFDMVVIHNSTGYHYYYQPHAGSGWAVFRAQSGHGARYVHEMDYVGLNSLYYYSEQDPYGADNWANPGGGRIFNNNPGGTSIHIGQLGTTIWWTAINILDDHAAANRFRAIIGQSAGPAVAVFFSNTKVAGSNTIRCNNKMSS